MSLSEAIDKEVTFISGVDRNGIVAPVAFETWSGQSIPAKYDLLSAAAKWGNAVAGTPATVSYAFQTKSSWTTEEKVVFKTAMSLWSAVSNVTFIETSNEAGADFRINRGSDGGAYWNFGNLTPQPTGGTTLLTPKVDGTGYPLLSIDPNGRGFGPISLDLEVAGGYPFGTVVHELGHGLGLGHGGPYNGEVNAETQQFGPYDMTLWTLMSYIDPYEAGVYSASYPVTDTQWGKSADGFARSPQTPMILDILAAQRLYGVATSGPLAEGGVVFGFNSNLKSDIGAVFDFSLNKHPVLTLWSAGTGNTLDLSGFSQNASINLQPGTFSSAAGLTNNIGIAFDTRIETAIGGSGDDVIIGNDLNNVLFGNAGNDTIRAGTGHNIIDGGEGIDTLVYSESRAKFSSLFDNTGRFVVNASFSSDISVSVEKVTFQEGTINVKAATDTALGVGALYEGLLFRDIDGSGFHYWAEEAAKGVGLSAIADSFLASDEYAARAGQLDDRAFIDGLYSNLFSRTADEEGALYWQGRLENGVSRADLVMAFGRSDEFQNTQLTGLFTKIADLGDIWV